MTLQSSAARRHGAVTVAITSGKGGVGKTSLAVNLAAALRAMGQRIGILDADFGLGSVDVMLGLAPAAHLGAVLNGECAMGDVVVDGPAGIRIVAAGSGIRALTTLGAPQWDRLVDGLRELGASLDFLLVDTSPGIGDHVIDVVRLADRVIVVTGNEPTSLVDAYAMVKLLLSASAHREIGIVVNAAQDADEGQRVFRQLESATRRFLGRPIRYYGCIERDPAVSEAVFSQTPLVMDRPDAAASRAYRRLALRVVNWPSRGPAVDLADRRSASAPAPLPAMSAGTGVSRCA
ncbi:MAG: MinD/ParA family protein [Acidobacteria bacterium]|nr:MinD/ParA family protein [Acidobacteriota bacterium]